MGEFEKFPWGRPPKPPSRSGAPPLSSDHSLSRCSAFILDVVRLVCSPPLPWPLDLPPFYNTPPVTNRPTPPPPHTPQSPWIALSATLKDLSATSKSRENPVFNKKYFVHGHHHTHCSLSPTHFESRSEAETEINSHFASPATALARWVLPVPGGWNKKYTLM